MDDQLNECSLQRCQKKESIYFYKEQAIFTMACSLNIPKSLLSTLKLFQNDLQLTGDDTMMLA